jgi:hypothetical protein
MVITEPQSSGPPKLILNPEVLAPAGGTTYSGQGYFNSGFIWGTKVPIPGPRTYSLTFDTPGAYKYTCILHDEMGMRGQIILQPNAAPASTQSDNTPTQLPSTGGVSNQDHIGLWVMAGGVVLLLAGAFFLWQRSKSFFS